MSGSHTYLRPTPVPKMPPGLVQLMEGLTREVLRKNPTDVYEFCAIHMETLLKIRDGSVLAQEQDWPPKTVKAKTQKKAVIKNEEYKSCNEKMHYGFKDNLITGEEVKDSSKEVVVTRNNVKVTMHHDVNLIKVAEIEIAQDKAISENIDQHTQMNTSENSDVPLTIIDEHTNTENNEIQNIDFPSCVEVKEGFSTDLSEIDNNGDINLTVSSLNEISKIEKEKTETLEQNVDKITSNVPYLTNTVGKEKNIQAVFITQDALDKDETKVLEILQEEIFAPHHMESENIIESCSKPNTVEITSEDLILPLNVNEESKTVVIDDSESTIPKDQVSEQNQVSPVVEDTNKQSEQKQVNLVVEHTNKQSEQKQVLPVFKDTDKRENENEVMVTTEEKSLTETSKESSEVNSLNVDVSKDENITLKSYEHNTRNSSTENLLYINNENNDIDYSKEDPTKENSVSNDINMINNVTDLKDKYLENSDSSLQFEDYKLSENDNNSQVKLESTYKLLSSQITNDNDVIEDTANNIEDLTEKTSNYTDDLEKNESSNNLSKKAKENINESSNMDLETAAITIQKVFRSFLFKSRGSTFEESVNDENVSNDTDKEIDIYTSPVNKERRSLGVTRMDSVLQTVNEEKSLSLSTDDSSTLSSAATIIQAHVRGFLARNRINSKKTLSINSSKRSDSPPATFSDNEENVQKNKTILNIHIVPEENRTFSREESVITSMDLSLDSSPPTSVNLHPLGYNKSEPRKQLKREDAFQSISPPSNNSGKHSEDVDSMKEIITTDNAPEQSSHEIQANNNLLQTSDVEHVETCVETNDSQTVVPSGPEHQSTTLKRVMSSDEADVITPFINKHSESNVSDFDKSTTKLMHSGEFHDVVLPTKVTRSDTSIVRGE